MCIKVPQFVCGIALDLREAAKKSNMGNLPLNEESTNEPTDCQLDIWEKLQIDMLLNTVESSAMAIRQACLLRFEQAVTVVKMWSNGMVYSALRKETRKYSLERHVMKRAITVR